MSEKDQGGWAFPSVDSPQTYPTNGMTLRDYFAAMAMQGMIANEGIADLPNEPARAHDAECAYAMADAMIAERSR